MTAPADRRITADPASDAALRRALGVGLGRPVGDPVALTPSVIATARAQRVQGLLWQQMVAGSLRADEALTDELRQAVVYGLQACLAAEESALLAVDALFDAGVPVRLLKGLAISHLDHREPSERLFADADLLVRPVDHDRALAALTAAGFGRAEPAVRGWWERRFGKAVLLNPPVGGLVDLHLRITGGYFAERIDHDALWGRTSIEFDLGGRTVSALDREMRLLQACCHCALGGGSGLRAMHDVAHLVLVAGADWEVTVEFATRDGADAVVAEALRRAWVAFDLDPAHPAGRWATTHVADAEQAAALAAYRASIGGQGWLPEGRSVLAALGPVDRARFLLGLAIPSRASLRARRRTRWQHLRRGLATRTG